MTKQVEIGRKWHDVPDEARWLAQDADGRWWWYTMPMLVEPNIVWRCYHDYIITTRKPQNCARVLYELVDED